MAILHISISFFLKIIPPSTNKFEIIIIVQEYSPINPGPETTTPESGSCTKGDWECDNGQCIPETLVDDNKCDCDDGSDEREGVCNSDQCQNGQWECNSGGCIPESYKCDGDRDCPDGSDEKEGCADSGICLDNEWKCNNGECIPENWYDDDECDCKDCSDEFQ